MNDGKALAARSARGCPRRKNILIDENYDAIRTWSNQESSDREIGNIPDDDGWGPLILSGAIYKINILFSLLFMTA